MPQPDTFADLVGQLEVAFPNRLPLIPTNATPVEVARTHWYAAGARAVIDHIHALFSDPADLAVQGEDAEPLDPDDLVVGPADAEE